MNISVVLSPCSASLHALLKDSQEFGAQIQKALNDLMKMMSSDQNNHSRDLNTEENPIKVKKYL